MEASLIEATEKVFVALGYTCEIMPNHERPEFDREAFVGGLRALAQATGQVISQRGLNPREIYFGH